MQTNRLPIWTRQMPRKTQLPDWLKKNTKNLNRTIASKEIEFITGKISAKENPDPDASLMNTTKDLKEN